MSAKISSVLTANRIGFLAFAATPTFRWISFSVSFLVSQELPFYDRSPVPPESLRQV